MSDDGFAALAARSEKVRNEHRLLLEGLRSFEQKLVDLVSGIRCRAQSDVFTFEEFVDCEGEVNGAILGYLCFDGKELSIGSKEEPSSSWEPNYWSVCSLEKAGVEWQRKVSEQEILDSLLANLVTSLDTEYERTAPVVQSLAQFVTIEKSEIDADLDELFKGHNKLLKSWMKSRKCVQSDPELSITLSCSHVETVLKGCLASLGQTGYEKDAIEKLGGKVLDVLKKASVVDEATSQMLRGVGTFFLGIGTIRNAKSVSHGKADGYVPPTPELAQTVNHLAGVASAFVMKHTEMYLRSM